MGTLVKKVRNLTLNYLLPNGFYFSRNGYCPCCEKHVIFQSFNSWLRDFFLCSNCGSIPRERALMLVIEKHCPKWKSLNIHESSPSSRGASLKLQKNAKNYIASQYYRDKPFGILVDNFQNQDLENQTFEDESFDIVVTQDVMEHIYNPAKAFAEIARTLKKGGAHIFTVPIINRHMPTEVWAIKGENNSTIFLKTPEWHGNPVDPEGSPVTIHWGFDIVNFIQKSCNMESIIEYIDNIDYGIRAEFIEVIVSKKQK
ncbi:MAG: class I SAM-dependent methyltransferase [Mariniphaga sp.]